MNIYYILSRDSLNKYNMTNVATMGPKTIAELQSDIKKIVHFCREETSIETSELTGYLASGITLYALDNTPRNALKGVLNFDINGEQINILGVCAPEPSVGVGSLLLNAVKTFAEQNGMKNIVLTCYGNVVDFYTNPKNVFRITSQRPISVYNSDSDSDSDEDSSAPVKMKYELNYVVDFAGGKRKRTRHTKRIKKTVKKTSKRRKSRKCRKSRK